MVGDIVDEIEQQTDQTEYVKRAEHHRIVPVDGGLEAEKPQAVQGEDHLDQERAGEQDADEGAGEAGHDDEHGVAEGVAGFPSAFVGILFTGSLLIEVIFSLDGLGLLGFEAAINRDYPVMFGTLYFFTLLGLLLNLAGDLMYVVIDPRIDFETQEV